MRRFGLVGCVLAAGLAGSPPPAVAQAPPRDRPLRVGNTNLVQLGVAAQSFDHPNYDTGVFPNIGYMHRVLRREVRWVPLWLRGAVNFHGDDQDLKNTYTVWPSNRPPGTLVTPDDEVAEHTSDFAFRGEFIADVLHVPHGALYAGGGFAVHYLSFSSRGCGPRPTGVCTSNSFKTTESRLAPSAAAGVRLHAVKRPYTAYGEVRYARVYGKVEVPPNSYLTDETFDFSDANAVSFEAGIGLHW